jgi:hypothetical protein
MATIGNLETIIKISRENYEILINGGTVGGYSYDPEAMYLVKDGYTFITDDEIIDLWWGGDTCDVYIKGGVIYSANEISKNVAYICLTDEGIKNGIMYI